MKWKVSFNIFGFIAFCFIVGEARWCTRSKSEQIMQQVTDVQKCNRTYQDSCSFFNWKLCTYSELVDCEVKKNITVTRYFVVEDCCPGFKMDPINNYSCIPSTVTEPELVKSGMTVSRVDKDRSRVAVPRVEKDQIENVSSGTESAGENVVSSTASTVDDDDDDDDGGQDGLGDSGTGRVAVDDDDNLLFGLSHGAYAGIICTLLFFLCVFILIMLHIRKRSRKAKAKEKKSSAVEMETVQRMLNPPA